MNVGHNLVAIDCGISPKNSSNSGRRESIVANLADIEKAAKRQNVTSWAVKDNNYLLIHGSKNTKLATIMPIARYRTTR